MNRIRLSLVVVAAVVACWFAPGFDNEAAAQPYPEFKTRAAALTALEDDNASTRMGGVVWFGQHGLAGDGPLLVKRLADRHPYVREAAVQAVWLAWSRSGDAETDRMLNRGSDEMSAGRHAQAIRIFSDVIRRRPEFAEGWNKRATAYYLAGELDKSLADCNEVIKRNPQHFGALSGYGQIYLKREEYDKAIDYFRRALAVNPNLSDLEEIIPRLEETLRERRRRMI
jgi:tetratricopeptide (TPR) repeat protein